MKMHLMMPFHFSVSIVELEFPPINFLACHFFTTFIRKLLQMLILTLFSVFGWFNRKNADTVRFSIIKIRIFITFMHLRSKLTLEICHEVGSLEEKTKKNRLKEPTLPPFFFSKNRCIYWKAINANRFFVLKIKIPSNFMCLRLKMRLEICQEVVSLDLRIDLNIEAFSFCIIIF